MAPEGRRGSSALFLLFFNDTLIQHPWISLAQFFTGSLDGVDHHLTIMLFGGEWGIECRLTPAKEGSQVVGFASHSKATDCRSKKIDGGIIGTREGTPLKPHSYPSSS